MSRCRDCRAEIQWVATDDGYRMPLDQLPYHGGDARVFVIRNVDRVGRGPIKTGIAVGPAAFPGERLYRSHLDTCMNPRQVRRRERRGL